MVAPSIAVNVPRLVTCYYALRPDPAAPAQRVAFGTSGHRGSALDGAFNEWHILAITQAICLYRQRHAIHGPLFLGMDTHALSEPAFASALEVLAGNKVEVMLADDGEYTPTPAVSHAILTHNRGRRTGLADGIVITPSHNPPEDGGFKYDPPHGGPAESRVTGWIEAQANRLLHGNVKRVTRISFERALRASTTHRYDFRHAYVNDLASVVDMEVIRAASLKLGVDPLGGAGIRYWPLIAERFGLDLAIVNDVVDPTFRFMTADWDGRLRTDPSSPHAMQRLIGLRDAFDVAFACDADHDRHGIVAKGAGLLPTNHYLAVAIHHLFGARSGWRRDAAVGKTIVTSSLIDRVAARLGRPLYEVPVGFKWFVEGLLTGRLGVAAEESAGASFLRRDGTVWTTDKDGITASLLAAEITAHRGRDPGEIYRDLAGEMGDPVYERIEVPVTAEQQSILKRLSAADVHATALAGEQVRQILTAAPGDGSPIGGIKVIAQSGWFAVRPSGTERVYKLYAESFLGDEHLRRIREEAQAWVAAILARRPG